MASPDCNSRAIAKTCNVLVFFTSDSCGFVFKRVAPTAVGRDFRENTRSPLVRQYAEEERVRKFAQTCAIHISKSRRELVGILLQTKHSSSDLFEKLSPKTEMPGVVPILSLHEFSTRGWRENYLHRYGRRRANSARNCSQVTDWARSRSRLAKRLASSACCACGSGISVSARLSQSWPIRARRSSGLSSASSSQFKLAMDFKLPLSDPPDNS